MTLTELRYIVAVSQECHFGRAAKVCNVSQPTLSIAVKKLEDELGIGLFDRSSNEVIVTEIGKQIIEQAGRVLEESDRLKHLAERRQDELEGSFKLGLIFTVAPYLLPKLIMPLHAKAPKMPLVLEENYTHVLTEMLKKGTLDAMVVAEPFHESGIETIPLYDEPFFVIVPKGHPLEERDMIASKQLVKERILLLTEGNCMRDNILSNCRELAAAQTGLQGIANTLQGSSINTIRHMVAGGLAISILPASSLTENDHLLFSVVPFKQPVPSRRVILAYRKNFIRPKAIEAIRQAVLESQLRGVKFVTE